MPNADSMANIRLMWPRESHPEMSALVMSSDNNSASSSKTSWKIRCSRSWIVEGDMNRIGLNERVMNSPAPEHVVLPCLPAVGSLAGEPEFAEQIANQHVLRAGEITAADGRDASRERRSAQMFEHRFLDGPADDTATDQPAVDVEDGA